MSIRLFLSTTLAAVCLVGVSYQSAQADTVTEKPRLAIALTDGTNFSSALASKLDQTHRFQLVAKAPDLGGLLQQKNIKLDASLSVQNSLKARNVSNYDMAIDGSVRKTGGTLRITARLYDFRSGEFSRDLSLMGDNRDVTVLAGQLANFVRESAPIRCLIKDANEDQLILDLGAMDGVTVGSMYRIYRNPLNMTPVPIGTLRVTEVQPFAAVGEVEDSVKGYTPATGDALVEETSGLLLNPR